MYVLSGERLLQISSGQHRGPHFRGGGGFGGYCLEVELLLFGFRRQLKAADRYGRRLESLEPEHRPNALFYSTVVLLNHVIEVLAGAYPGKVPTSLSLSTARCEAA